MVKQRDTQAASLRNLTTSLSVKNQLIKAAKRLSDEVDAMQFTDPVTHVYNPLAYAWRCHEKYLSMCPDRRVKTLFLGMNPGPWGMAQTGVPFGQVAMVRDWLGICEPVERPRIEHPKRPIQGFNCRRSEVSGARLWGLFEDRFQKPKHFFKSHFVINYCPLVFMEASARNRTPDKLPAKELQCLQASCDSHLRAVVLATRPDYLVGIGSYAEKCLIRVLETCDYERRSLTKVVRILHPSPASPAANKDWAKVVTQQLITASVW